MRVLDYYKIKLITNHYLNKLGFFRPGFERIKKFRNCHLNKRAFIIGSGPSLRVEDLDKLKNEITFACNKIYLSFDTTDWRPTYYSVIDSMVAKNNARRINSYGLLKIFSNSIRINFLGRKDIYWLKDISSPKINGKLMIKFSEDISAGVYGGYTVIYTMLQIAYYMGIREVYLLGIDFSFDVPKPSHKKSPVGETLLFSDGEINHFHPDYRKKGEIWTMPRLDLQYQAFCVARDAYQAVGRMIYNASRETKLDVFRCVKFEDIL